MFLKDKVSIGSEREYTDEGFLNVPARISRTGIHEYLPVELGRHDRNPDDVIKVYRPPEEVFSDDSLRSFANKPVTNDHPPELVNASNSRLFSVGMSGPEITREDTFAKAMLHIIDEEAIKKIESGKTELSNGYTSDIEWARGTAPDGAMYDAIQRNIRGNHIALVERGRSGPACRLADNLPGKGDKLNMAKVSIDGVDFDMSDQAAQAVGKLQDRLKEFEDATLKKTEELKSKEAESKATEDTLRAELDDAKSRIPTPDIIDKIVAERTAVIDMARKIAPEIEYRGRDIETLRREVVALKCPAVQLDSVSLDYINARFDILAELAGSNSQQQLDDALKKQLENRDEDNRPLDVIAREKMIADSQKAWKKGDK